MPFSLTQAADDTASRLTRSGPTSLIRNPIAAALIITALALAIVFAIIVECKQSSWRARMRCAVYIFIGVSVLLALHYYGMTRSMESKFRSSADTQLIDQIQHTQTMPTHMQPSYVPVRTQFTTMQAPAPAQVQAPAVMQAPARPPAMMQPPAVVQAPAPVQNAPQPGVFGAGEPMHIRPLSLPLM